MVSLTRRKRGSRSGWRISFRIDRRLKEICLRGDVTKLQARTIAGHIGQFLSARSVNLSPPADTVAWASGTKGMLRKRLISLGFLHVDQQSFATPSLLSDHLTAYIDARKDMKPATKFHYNRTKALLNEYLGPKMPLSAITTADGDRWKSSLLARPMAPATVAKHIKRAKTMLSSAVRDKLLADNPFQGVTAGRETNPHRQAYIDRQKAADILAACPDTQWKLIFGLARYCGLRCPSEILGLTWSDIDWAQSKIRIDSPKTGLRQCPLFAEIRPILTDAREIAADGETYIIARYQHSTNLGTQLRRILKRAGIAAWPKLYNNLRASCRTDLQEHYPDHVIDAWLGHSAKTAAAHYLQVTPDHWTRAAQELPNTFPNIRRTQRPKRTPHRPRAQQKNR